MNSPKLIDGDLVIENGNLLMIEGDEELAQSVRSVLQTRKGEFFLDPEHGMSFDNLLGKTANQDETRDDIIEALSQIDELQAVNEVTFIDDRRARKRNVVLSIEKSNAEELVIEVPLNA